MFFLSFLVLFFFFDQKALFFWVGQTAPFFDQKIFNFSSTNFPFSQAHFIQRGTTLAPDTLG